MIVSLGEKSISYHIIKIGAEITLSWFPVNSNPAGHDSPSEASRASFSLDDTLRFDKKSVILQQMDGV